MFANIFSSSSRSKSKTRRTTLPAPAPVVPPSSGHILPPTGYHQMGYYTRDKHHNRSHSSQSYIYSNSGSERSAPSPRAGTAVPRTPTQVTSSTSTSSERYSSRGRDTERRQRTSDSSSRSRSRIAQQPLKPCLKQSSRTYNDSPVYSAEQVKHGLESRHRSRRDSTPSGHSYGSTPPPRRTRSSSQSSEEYVGKISRGPLKAESISLHWLLSNKFQKKQRTPPIFFDVAFNPRQRSNILGLAYKPQLDKQVLEPVPECFLTDEASTHCTLTSMVINCPRGPLSDVRINVTNPKGVTCMDVFEGVYDVYRYPLSKEDVKLAGEDYLVRCLRHYHKRIEDGPYTKDSEERSGLRYVDLLRGSRRRIFKGLTQRPDGPRPEWDLHFETVEA